jgi:hypothetical protein
MLVIHKQTRIQAACSTDKDLSCMFSLYYPETGVARSYLQRVVHDISDGPQALRFYTNNIPEFASVDFSHPVESMKHTLGPLKRFKLTEQKEFYSVDKCTTVKKHPVVLGDSTQGLVGALYALFITLLENDALDGTQQGSEQFGEVPLNFEFMVTGLNSKVTEEFSKQLSHLPLVTLTDQGSMLPILHKQNSPPDKTICFEKLTVNLSAKWSKWGNIGVVKDRVKQAFEASKVAGAVHRRLLALRRNTREEMQTGVAQTK